MKFLACAAVIVQSVCAGVAPAWQPPEPKASQPATARPTRADLAQVYLRFEQAMQSHPPAAAEVADINRAFDSATLQFFGGTYSDSIRILSETTDRVIFGDAVTSNRAFASSLKISVSPPVMALTDPAPVTVKVEPLYPAQPVGAVTVRIVAPDGREVFHASTTEIRASFTVNAAKFTAETYRAEIAAGDDVVFSSRLVVSDQSLNQVREDLLKRLSTAPAGTAGLELALSACRSRIKLLTDSPSVEESAQFLADPTALRKPLDQEIAALLESRDPYRRKPGDYWREFSLKGLDLPSRIYAPAKASGSDPVPLLIALHGAGGDESMFLDGYGAGVLKSIADKRGLLVVAPRTELLIGNATILDELIAAIGQDYQVDTSRIYLLGHSLGAGAAAGLSVQRPDTIAAACLIAGFGRFSPGKPIPPTLAIAGELDPLMKASQVEAGAAKAKAGGLPVELRMIKGRGHTLIVGEQLPEAIDWLLKHRK